jgi:hypothetical protein
MRAQLLADILEAIGNEIRVTLKVLNYLEDDRGVLRKK